MVPQYKTIPHGTTVKEICDMSPPKLPIVIVGLHSGNVFYDGRFESADETVMSMAVAMAHPDQKKYAYFGRYDGEDKETDVYLFVVHDGGN